MANDPLAPRMCAIAFLSFNITLACMFGSFGVLLNAVEAKFGVTREISSLGIPLVSIGLAVTAPVAGVLAGRVSIRLLMLAGAFMNCAAYAVLASSTSIAVNLLAYGLLIGPGLAFTATVLPSMLVARWYRVNRGRAFGLISMPIANAILPLVAVATLRRYGLSVTYGLLAALTALLLLPLLFVVDFPPKQADRASSTLNAQTAAQAESSIGRLLCRRDFWALSLGWAAGSVSVTVAAAHLVPMTRGWGLDTTRAASLSTASFAGAIIGTFAFGWVAERIGGARAIALVCFNSAVLWAFTVLQPPYIVLMLLAALIGFHGGGVVSAFSMAVSQFFDRATFGRALGLGHLVGLPLNFLGVPMIAHLYTRTGSYAGAILGLSAFLMLIVPVVATARRPDAAA